MNIGLIYESRGEAGSDQPKAEEDDATTIREDLREPICAEL